MDFFNIISIFLSNFKFLDISINKKIVINLNILTCSNVVLCENQLANALNIW